MILIKIIMPLRYKIIWMTLFAVAMGFLESAVVIYMRELLYPDGFAFPLSLIPGHLVLTELLREVATILMLLSIAVIAGQTFLERFAWFIYIFGVWDIFYYIFLKVMINWPASLLTWDLLFLIPTTWTGPVVAPVIVSILMIIMAICIIKRNKENPHYKISRLSWILTICGSIIIFTAFIYDYSSFILNNFSFIELLSLPSQTLYDLSLKYIPLNFPWVLLVAGSTLIIIAIIKIIKHEPTPKNL